MSTNLGSANSVACGLVSITGAGTLSSRFAHAIITKANNYYNMFQIEFEFEVFEVTRPSSTEPSPPILTNGKDSILQKAQWEHAGRVRNDYPR
ncbi:hypothetical protein WBG78_14185 [Chryseolinea sp. T2]|uniref:hypothetical protein n=1 Tax=Chryseolinea sp. T2 TaxID=3129255 RepID=UPI003078306B